MIQWWLDKGIDGFRVDAISHIKKLPFSIISSIIRWKPTPMLQALMFI